MRKHLLVAIALLGALAPRAWAYDFSAVAPSGQTLYYEINGSNVTVVPPISSYPYYGTYPTGALTIPGSVTYNGTTYSVTSIGRYAFETCSGLTSVTIPNSVTFIGNYAFYNCSRLTSVTIPNSVTSIGEGAFSDCTGLTSVTIGNSVTSIGRYAFDYCSGLTSVICKGATPPTLGNISSIPTTATITVPCGATSAYTTGWGSSYTYQEAFLFELNVASSNDTMGTAAVQQQPSCTSGTAVIAATADSGFRFDHWNDGNTDNPRTITMTGDTSFLAYFTADNTPTVTVGDTVIVDCLRYRVATDSTVAVVSFESCVPANLTIPSTVTLGGATYSVTSIGNSAFYNCSGLTSVTIGNSVTSIGGNAFFRCSGLTSVTIPNSVTSIGNGAFEYCSGLTSVTIPNSVTSIGISAFYNCSGLTSVTIPNSITSIGSSAFSGTGLTSVTIPNSVTSIGQYAFHNCRGLASMTVAAGNTHYDSRNNCNAIIETSSNTLVSGCKTTVIPNSVTSIGADAFEYCSGLTSVTIPNSVTSIGSQAFLGCSGLTSVTIPNSVTSIGTYAFHGCSGLTSVICKGATPPTLGYNGIPTTPTITVPCGAISAYTTGWGSSYTYQEASLYDLNVASSNDTMGTAAVQQQPSCTSGTAVIAATANSGFRFTRWSDGDTNNPRTISVISDTNFVAEFDGTCQGTFSTQYDTACDRYTWHNTAYTTSGIYVYDYNNLNGCPSADTLHLTVNHQTTHITTIRSIDSLVCDNEGFIWNRNMYDHSVIDTVEFSLGNSQGCDSIDILDLEVLPAGRRFYNQYGCDPVEGYEWNGLTYYQGGTEIASMLVGTAANGCDSLDVLNLSFRAPQRYIYYDTACDVYTWSVANWDSSAPRIVGTYVASNNTAQVTVQDQYGCDSTINLNLTINHGTFAVDTATSHGTYTWHGTTYTSSGIYTYNYTNSVGCLSADTLRLTILSNVDTTYTVTAVNSLGGGRYTRGATAVVMAAPQVGMRFLGWADGITTNPRSITVMSDTTLTPLYAHQGADTVFVHDTTTVNHYIFDTVRVYDTMIVVNIDTLHHYQYDTTRIFDTLNVVNFDTLHHYHYDTTSVNHYTFDTVRMYDTLTVFNVDTLYHYHHDTTRVFDTLIVVTFDTLHHYHYDTVANTLHHYHYDTTRVFDTLIVVNVDTLHHYHFDTTRVFDTLTVLNIDTLRHYYFDTTRMYDTLTVVNLDTLHHYYFDTTVSIDTLHHYHYDTTRVTNIVYDTTVVTRYTFDTVWMYDTLIVVNIDTLHHHYYDTMVIRTIYDTTSITHYIYTYDTVYIYDTIYMNSNGIDGAAPANMKVYTTRAEIVVEGTEGMPVQLYDISGRLLERRDEGEDKVKFLAPASGTYIVRLGDRTVRKVVVIR